MGSIVTVFAVGIGLYIAYELIKGLKAAAGAAGHAISAAGGAVYQAAATATTPISAAIAGIWNAMTLQNSMGATGSILWPDGTYTPVSQTGIRTDSLGNVYALDSAGRLYQLQPSDINGDFPASQITDPSQIGRSPS